MSDITLGIRITADGKNARAEVVGLTGDLSKLEAAGSKASGGLDKAGKAADGTAKSLKSAGKAASDAEKSTSMLGLSTERLVKIFSVAALFGYTKALVEIGDRANLLDSRLKLVTNSAAQFSAVQQALYQQAQYNGSSIEAQADLYAKLARATEGTGRSAQDLLTITDVVAKNLRISGTSAGQAAGAMLQFGQAAGSGVVHAEEFNSMLEGMPTLVQGVARALGITVAELKNLVSQGQITSAQWLDAMVKMKESTDKQAGAMAGTFGQAFERMKNSVFEATAEIDRFIGVSKGAADLMNSIAGGIDRLTGKALSPDQAIAGIQKAAKDLFDIQTKFEQHPFGSTAFREGEINRAKQALSDAQEAYARAQEQAQKVGNTLTEGFGKAKLEVQNVGKEAEATMAAIVAAAKKYNVPEAFALAVAKAESNYQQSAVSPAGAIGVMQLMPDTAKRLSVDARDAMQNIDGGVKLLAQLLKRYGDDFKRAAAAYNAGPGAVDRYGGTPPYKETQNYVQRVSALYSEFQQKYPNGLDFVNAAGQKADIAQAKAQLDDFVNAQIANAKAAETIAKSQLAVQVQLADIQRKAFEEHTRQAASDLQGNAKIAYLQQAAQQEQAIIQQQTALKQRAIQIEQQAAQAELSGINQRIAAADKLNLTESERAHLVDQRKQVEAEIASLTQQANAVAIAGTGELVNAQMELLDAQQKEMDNIKAAAQARDEYLAGIDAQIKAIQTGNEALTKEAELHKLTQGMAADEAKAWEDSARAKLESLDAVKKAQEDQKKAEQAVSDDILRQGQYYQAMAQMAQQAAAGMADAFGKTGAALGGMVVAIANANQYLFQIGQQTDAQIKKINEGPGTSDEKAQKIRTVEMQGQTQELAAQLNLYGSVATAAQGFFEKGTSGYKAMQTASQVFHAAELAASIAATTQKAIEAIATQATAGPYIGFALMAAMAAALGAIGAFSGSAGGGSVGAASIKTGGTGTVLGDETAKSESLKNSLDKLEQTNSADLAYSAQMTRSLKNIESALAGVTATLLINVNAFSALAGKYQPGQGKIKDYGIGFYPQSVADILGSGFDVQAYTKGTPTGGATATYIASAGKEVNDQFTLVIRGLVETLTAGAHSFGASSEEFRKKLDAFQIEFSALSLRDDKGKALKGSELQDAIDAYFSTIADQMAQGLKIDKLQDFQVAGEGLFQTFTRVSGAIDESSTKLASLGVEVVNYRDIELKRASDLSAEIARESIVAKEGGSAIGAYINDAVGSIDDLIEAYKGLLVISDQMRTFGIDADNLTRAMVNAAGGVQALGSAMDSFAQNFYGQGEQVAASMATLGREFGSFGVILPKSKDAFKQMIESIDTSSQAGQELFGHMISLADSFAKAADQAEALEKKYRSYVNPLGSYKDQLDTVISDFTDILDSKLGVIEAKYSNTASIQKAAVNAPLQGQIDFFTGYNSQRQSEIAQNFTYLSQTTTRINELTDLIARWSGAKGAAGYVAQWQSELSAMNAQADILRGDIAAKTAEVNSINDQINAILTQMAQNSADVDTSLLGAKLDELTKEKSRILRQEGNVLLDTLQKIWDDMIGQIKDAQNSVRRQIAELKGIRAVDRFTKGQQSDAIGALRAYDKSGANDPAREIQLIQSAQQAIMDHYTARLEVLTRQMERAAKPQIREIKENTRAQEKEIKVQLRIDTREINKQLRIDTRAVQHDANQRIREINRAGAAAIETYRAQVSAHIDRINAQMDAAMRGLEDLQQAQTDALQDQQDARMQALQDEQKAATKALQKRQAEESKLLQDQLSAAQQLQQVYQQIADYARQLKTGGLSSLSPEDKLKEAQQQYQDLLAKAQAGDATAAGKVTGAADTYLNLQKQYYGSSTQYDAAYKQIVAELDALGSKTVQTDPIEAAITALQESQEKELDALQKSQEAESKALQRVFQEESRAISRTQQDASEALRQTFQDRIDRVNEHAQKIEDRMQKDTDRQVQKIQNQTDRTVAKLEREAQRQIDHAQHQADRQINQIERQQTRAIEALTNPNKNEAIKDLKQRTIAKLEALDTRLENMKAKAVEQMATLIAETRKLGVLNAHQLRQLNKMGETMGVTPTDIPSYASGGYARKGLALVGEHGPEFVRFNAPARVISNADSKAALRSDDEKIVAAIEELKTELKALTRTQSAANPRLVNAIEVLADETAAMRRDVKTRPPAKS